VSAADDVTLNFIVFEASTLSRATRNGYGYVLWGRFL